MIFLSRRIVSSPACLPMRLCRALTWVAEAALQLSRICLLGFKVRISLCTVMIYPFLVEKILVSQIWNEQMLVLNKERSNSFKFSWKEDEWRMSFSAFRCWVLKVRNVVLCSRICNFVSSSRKLSRIFSSLFWTWLKDFPISLMLVIIWPSISPTLLKLVL